jgi:hypothetical protein
MGRESYAVVTRAQRMSLHHIVDQCFVLPALFKFVIVVLRT